MQYGVLSDFAGLSGERYEALHAPVAPLERAAPGFVAHIAGPSDGGWYTLELWESRADRERFLRQVGPMLPPDRPRPVEVREFAVHSRRTRGWP